ERVEPLKRLAHIGLRNGADLRPCLPPRANDDFGSPQNGPQLVDDGALDVAGGKSAGRAWLGASFEHVHVDVVAVELAVPPRVAWRHGGAGRAEDEALEQSRGAGAATGGSLARALLEDRLDPVPELAVDDRLVLARVGRALVPGLPDVHRVGDH